MTARLFAILALASLSLLACGDEAASADPLSDASQDAGAANDASDAEESDAEESDTEAIDTDEGEALFAEIEAVYTRYLGAFPPTSEVVDGNETTFAYDYALEDGGPACIRGAPYRVSIRDNGSPNTLFFMQGGGLCYSAFCFAIEEAGRGGVPRFDVLDPDEPANPFADWNVVYLPYCDGSLFAGDISYDSDGDGEPNRIHRGFQNLSVGMDALVARFGASERVVLAGSSGGAFGTIWAAPLARMNFPDAELLVFNDAGVGVARGNEPEFVLGLVEEFGAADLVPPSCADCLDDGHLTRLIDWVHVQDPGLRTAAFSSYGDSVIATIFLQISGDEFEDALREQLGGLAEAHPGRYAALLIEGQQHTVLLGDISGFLGENLAGDDNPFESIVSLARLSDTFVGEVSAADWLTWFVEGDERWVPLYAE